MWSFQLTRSRGAWLLFLFLCVFHFKFQLTRSRGAWRYLFYILEYEMDFNSHAHVERDTFHAMLTRLKRISTHTLTWSVTWKPSTAYFNPKTFQLTRSRGAWRVITLSDPMKNLNFNSHAHVERDVMTFCLPCFSKFQLTRSRGAWPHVLRVLLLCRLFQLTRSRGAWRKDDTIRIAGENFNSHAHVERDDLQSSSQ